MGLSSPGLAGFQTLDCFWLSQSIMSDSLFSPYWYRAANLHPRLSSTTRVSRQVFQGEPWFVLSNQTTGRQFRVNKLGYELVGRLDGLHSVQEVWDTLIQTLGEDAPSQNEVLGVLSELIGAGMLHSEHSQDFSAIFEASKRRQNRTEQKLNPFAFKLPLYDPSQLLDYLAPLGRRLFTPRALLAWIFLTCTAAIIALMHWPELRAYSNTYLGNPRNIVLMWFAYPMIKTLHELGHALAIRTWGGSVHEFGVSLFLLMPIPYVDASAASAFPEKKHRFMVSAMGVIVELTISALLFFVWLNISDGVLRELCFASMSIASLSTVLVNANPLMRFDGYYMLTDSLELPGLSSRADNYLRYLGERWLLGNHQLPPPAGIENSRLLLLSFGTLSWLYRLMLMLGIALWLLSKQLALGVLISLWITFKFIFQPFIRTWALVFKSSRLAPVRTRAVMSFSFLVIVFLLYALAIPAPFTTQAQGIVWVPENARIRNDTPGFVKTVLTRNGEHVTKGQILLILENPELFASRKTLQTRLKSQEQAYQGALLHQVSEAITLKQENEEIKKQLAQIDQKIAALTLRAPQTGTLGMPLARDLSGRFFERGSTVANLISPEKMTLRIALNQEDIELVTHPETRFFARTSENRKKTLPARLITQTPAPSWQLPSALLGDRAGGPFTTDPNDRDGLTTLKPVFTIDIEVDKQNLARIGGRAWIRIEHPPQPLVMQWWRHMQLLLLRYTSSAPPIGAP